MPSYISKYVAYCVIDEYGLRRVRLLLASGAVIISPRAAKRYSDTVWDVEQQQVIQHPRPRQFSDYIPCAPPRSNSVSHLRRAHSCCHLWSSLWCEPSRSIVVLTAVATLGLYIVPNVLYSHHHYHTLMETHSDSGAPSPTCIAINSFTFNLHAGVKAVGNLGGRGFPDKVDDGAAEVSTWVRACGEDLL